MINRRKSTIKRAPLLITIIGIWLLTACQTAAPETIEIIPTTPPTPRPTATVHADAGKQTIQSISFTAPDQETTEETYLIYLPEGYNGEKKWPLLISLHGSNGRGSNISSVLYNNSINLDLNADLDLPAIVFSPQAPTGSTWNGQLPLLELYLTAIEEKYAVDSSRIYLTGFSMGGIGSWAWGVESPDRFAAIIPVAGGIIYNGPIPENICDLKNTPIWAFAGAEDRSIPPSRVQKVVEALEECGANNIRLTVYDNAGHREAGIWPYQEDSGLYEWLWEQQQP